MFRIVKKRDSSDDVVCKIPVNAAFAWISEQEIVKAKKDK
jgi:hypothetical protein